MIFQAHLPFPETNLPQIWKNGESALGQILHCMDVNYKSAPSFTRDIKIILGVPE